MALQSAENLTRATTPSWWRPTLPWASTPPAGTERAQPESLGRCRQYHRDHQSREWRIERLESRKAYLRRANSSWIVMGVRTCRRVKRPLLGAMVRRVRSRAPGLLGCTEPARTGEAVEPIQFARGRIERRGARGCGSRANARSIRRGARGSEHVAKDSSCREQCRLPGLRSGARPRFGTRSWTSPGRRSPAPGGRGRHPMDGKASAIGHLPLAFGATRGNAPIR